MRDLKSLEHCARVGSNPIVGTKLMIAELWTVGILPYQAAILKGS